MGKIRAEMNVSLDGYIAGPDVTVEEPLGLGGEALFDWLYADRSPSESEAWEREYYSSVGALIIGRRMADVGIDHWGENPSFHAPCFVVTHRAHPPIVKAGGTSYTFVTDGPDAALELATNAAGARDVQINGGATILTHYLNSSVVAELRLNIVPTILGSGTSLFDKVHRGFRPTLVGATSSAHAAHLTFTIPLAG